MTAINAAGPDRANDQSRQDQTKMNKPIIVTSAPNDNHLDAWNAGRATRDAAELASEKMLGRNSAAVYRIAVNSLARRGAFGFKPAGVNRFESHIGRMCWEFPPQSSARKVTARTVTGTLVGHASKSDLGLQELRQLLHNDPTSRHKHTMLCNTLARARLYQIDDAGIDRQYLHGGRYLFTEEELPKLLDPLYLTARDDYAARLYLALRRLGLSRPHGKNMRAAIARIEEWALINAVPDWMRAQSNGGAV